MGNVKEKLCAFCGKPFITARVNQRFCSTDCCYKWQLQTKNRHTLENQKIYKKCCAICGKPFTTNIKTKIYCGVGCSYQAQKNRNAKRYKDADQRPDNAQTAITKMCKGCGKEFTTIVHHQLYCAPNCRSSKKVKKVLSLAEVAQLAKESGMTYGKYVQTKLNKEKS